MGVGFKGSSLRGPESVEASELLYRLVRLCRQILHVHCLCKRIRGYRCQDKPRIKEKWTLDGIATFDEQQIFKNSELNWRSSPALSDPLFNLSTSAVPRLPGEHELCSFPPFPFQVSSFF